MATTKIQASLLSKGYFPKELPDAFTTKDFGNFSEAIISEWRQSGVFKIDTKGLGKLPGRKTRRDSYTYTLESADAEIFSVPKRGYERRNIHVTHPVSQGLLAQEMARNWTHIQRWISRQAYSMDEIRVSDRFERSVKGINFPLHREKKAYIEATSDWVVKTDITRFYPTIYTNSIPWAAYGKEKVKSNINLYKGSLADRLDVLVRAGNRNQTIGIPIGPETSRIIAEIISARIDSEFQSTSLKIPSQSVDRLQDDWVVGVDTLEKATSVIAKISNIYRSYGLDINGSKTSIDHIIATKQESWISEIGAFLSHRNGKLHGARLREFLTLCLRLQSEHQHDPVINYALSVIEGSKFSSSDVRDMESFLLKAAVVAPNSLDRICRIILDIQYHTNAISTKRVSDRFVALIERHLDKEHHYEIVWLLYTLRGLGRKFSSRRICEQIETLPSAAIALLLLDMSARGILVGRLPTSTWEINITEERILADWTWLLGYEGFRHGWLQDKKRLMKTPFFEPMAKRNVVFYDPRRNVRTSRSIISDRLSLRRKQEEELRQFFSFMRQIDPYEY